ncbi:ribosome silencing factor [Kaarinaea lacus]|jgi:ribosome-associated protein
MNAEELTKVVIDALEDMKAQDIRVIDVRGKTSVTDVMVIASGTSTRQVKSQSERVIEKAKEHGIKPLGVEGEKEAQWVLVDLGDVVVHMMQPEIRDFYHLEKLWATDEITRSESSN